MSGPSYLPQPMPIPDLNTWQFPTTMPGTCPLPFAPAGWSEDQDMLLQNQSAGIGGSGIRMNETGSGGESAVDLGESNDEYWNALIDGVFQRPGRSYHSVNARSGILGTTDGTGTGVEGST